MTARKPLPPLDDRHGLLAAVDAGDRVAKLEALERHLAEALVRTKSAREIGTLAQRIAEIQSELAFQRAVATDQRRK